MQGLACLKPLPVAGRRLVVRSVSARELFNAFSNDPLVVQLHAPGLTAHRSAAPSLTVQWPGTEPLVDQLRVHDDRRRVLCFDAADSSLDTVSKVVLHLCGNDDVTVEQGSWDQLSTAMAAFVTAVIRELPSVVDCSVVRGGWAAVLIQYPFMAAHDFQVCYPQQVLDHVPVYIGSEFCASQATVIRDLHITHIVNATQECSHHFQKDGILYLRVPVVDAPDAPMIDYFEEVFDFINQALATGGNVLIHCAQGKSRSACCLMAWLLSRDPALTPETALLLCQAARPYVQPNAGFMLQLRLYHKNRGL